MKPSPCEVRSVALIWPMPLVACLLAAAIGCGTVGAPEYGLPIKLGATSEEVRKVLGGPDERWKDPKVIDRYTDPETIAHPSKEDRVIERFNGSGLTVLYDRDVVSEVSAYRDWGGSQGFLQYSGTVLRGVRLSDSKATILKKLGEPTKIEQHRPGPEADPDVPVVWPAESTFYWRIVNYTLKVRILEQAQSLDSKMSWPKDTVTEIAVGH